MANESMQNFALPETNVVPTRQCDSYDPAPMMKVFRYEDGNCELYLEVKYRVDWFLHWCKENGVEGKIIESKIDFLPDVKMLLATCSVYMDEKLAAESTTGVQITENPADTNIAVQTAFTRAKGRALADLGFGTVNGNTGENGDNLPPDSGIPLPLVTNQTNPLFVGMLSNVSTPTPPPAAKDEQTREQNATGPVHKAAPAPGADTLPTAPAADNGESDIPQTVEEAKAFICPIGKETTGKSLGHIMATAPNMIRFYAGPNFNGGTRHPGLVAAAKLLVANEDF